MLSRSCRHNRTCREHTAVFLTVHLLVTAFQKLWSFYSEEKLYVCVHHPDINKGYFKKLPKMKSKGKFILAWKNIKIVDLQGSSRNPWKKLYFEKTTWGFLTFSRQNKLTISFHFPWVFLQDLIHKYTHSHMLFLPTHVIPMLETITTSIWKGRKNKKS